MRYHTVSSTITSAIFGLALLLAPVASAQVTYSGDAVAVKANVAGIINASISDTGQLPPSGGELASSLLDFTLPPVLDLHLLSANTVGENFQTSSQAAVSSVTLNVAGIYVTASVLNSNATATCFVDHAEASGGATVIGLKVNGLSVTVTGKPNQTVPLLVGSLVINEQIRNVTNPPDAITANMLVNALHLKVNLLADVVVSQSQAGTICLHPRQ